MSFTVQQRRALKSACTHNSSRQQKHVVLRGLERNKSFYIRPKKWLRPMFLVSSMGTAPYGVHCYPRSPSVFSNETEGGCFHYHLWNEGSSFPEVQHFWKMNNSQVPKVTVELSLQTPKILKNILPFPTGSTLSLFCNQRKQGPISLVNILPSLILNCLFSEKTYLE